ncbi:hypothetical protein yc1106_06943 [Curvularia clavata]|uniref:C3H1-type domain-containing protein n=1 Tax=Curvularia clavata TaxID=95742 RepID=A0A9Q8ZDV6_CURCL|nr:hypothetical protein yc1106_06943 [Curvularia clavata]
MAQRHGKVDQYQTYALSMAGTKRKLIATADDSGPTGNDSSTQAPSKKICHNDDKYNPKYMAHMCFGAHMQRIHEAGMASYPWHVEEDYRQDLTCMFAHAHSKGSFRQDTAARHMIPRLAGIALRSKKDKTATVKEFIKHYDTVQEDLLLIQDILSGGHQADLDLVTSIRDCVASLHVTLLGSPRWRTIIPYTPLPKACLPLLRNFVANPKQSHFVSDLSDYISDMERWLTLPPPFVEAPTCLTAPVIDKLQQQTERSSGKAEVSPLQSGASLALAASAEEQQKKKINLLEERITKTDLLAEQRMGQINLLKEQLEKAMADRARLTDHVKTLELAAAEQAAKHKLKEKTWATAAELEKEHRKQITEQKSEIDRLNAALSAEQKRNAAIEAQRSKEIERLNTALGAERERSASIEANAARMVAQATDQMDVSIGVPDNSNLNTNHGFPEILVSSDAVPSKLTGGHANGQPHGHQQLTMPAVHQDIPVAMEVVDDGKSNDGEMDIDSFINTNVSSVPRPNLFFAGQVNRFERNVANGMAPQSDPGQDKVFKEACRDFKLGRCRRGKKCRFPHEACRRWLSGVCHHGEKCYRSHDPFFLGESELQPLPSQNPFVEKVATNNVLQAGATSMVPENQVLDTQPPMQTSWAHSPAPKAPNALFVRSRTQHEKADTSIPFAHVSELQNGGSLFNPLAAQSDLSQGLNQSVQPKKQACRNYLNDACSEGFNCKFAHSPCSFFMKGGCRFTDETCKKSHDPLFITQNDGSNDRSQYASSLQRKYDLQLNLQHLDDLIRLAGKNHKSHDPPLTAPCVSNDSSKYASQPQKTQSEFHSNLYHLDELIRAAARMREGNYGGKEKSAFAVLEVSDVEKACESAAKMNRVMQLQSFVPSSEKHVIGIDQGNDSSSQKASLPFNLRGSKERDQTKWDTPNLASNSTDRTGSDAQPDQSLAIHDFDMLTPTATTPTPFQDTGEDNPQSTPSHFIIAPPPTPHTQKRLTHLPPLQTSHPPSPSPSSSLPPVQSSFTPLFNHLKEEFAQAEAMVAYPDTELEQQQPQPQSQEGRMSVDRDLEADMEARVLAVQRATHEFNLRRREYEEAARRYEEARWRCEVARWRVERLRGG